MLLEEIKITAALCIKQSENLLSTPWFDNIAIVGVHLGICK